MPSPPPLTPATKARLLELSAAPPRSSAALRELVNQHCRRTAAVAARNPLVDAEKADRVAASCLAMLDASRILPPSARVWVQAACLYFAARDDVDDDFASESGFDDDGAVVNHVAALVGLSRLSVKRR